MQQTRQILNLQIGGLLALGWMVAKSLDPLEPAIVFLARTLKESGMDNCTYIDEILKKADANK